MTQHGQISAGLPTRQGDIPFTEQDFRDIAALAKAEYGLHLEPAKKVAIQSRLSRRIRALGLDGFADYCRRIAGGDREEGDHFITALTTNVTHFYRELHHFTMLERDILPKLADKARRGGKVRLWSAGCSTGQEPYSIAGSVLAVFPEAARHDVKILATDVDPQVLRIAEQGAYEADSCQFPTPALQARIFSSAARDGRCEVRPDLRALVTFRRLNLNAPWPISGRFDVILCRNVAIYFDRDTQDRLWTRAAEVLHPGAHLFIGHSERIAGAPLDLFENVGVTAYRRRETPGTQHRKEA
ncbi:MAG: protein-glutamate O-methyltransferase [Rhodobacteraceae bacterium]|nr:protein-glutamate O-methyltransferase [Paracoccaceae bacterium]